MYSEMYTDKVLVTNVQADNVHIIDTSYAYVNLNHFGKINDWSVSTLAVLCLYREEWSELELVNDTLTTHKSKRQHLNQYLWKSH